jgi:hypothetical protein
MRQWAEENVREAKPDLVVIAVPADANAPNTSRYIAAYEWILNFSLDFGPGTWDCVPVLPSVLQPELTEEQAEREGVARTLIAGKDLNAVDREAGDDATAQEILTRFAQSQYDVWMTEENAGE